MTKIKTVCICGGGGQCHAIAPWLASQGYTVNILTNRPHLWTSDFKYLLPNGEMHEATLATISNDPALTIPNADVVIVSVPGFVNREELLKIKPYLKPRAFVGGVFPANGFFFDAFDVLGKEFPLWGFQRVPFIGKVKEYGQTGNIMAYKTAFHIAVENTDHKEKEQFRQWIQKSFGQPTALMSSYFEVALSNSNPILHPARIYTWLKDWDGQTPIADNPLFYEEWPDEASEMYIALDKDLHKIIEVLPVNNDCLPFVLDYYEQPDAHNLSLKLRSIESFHGIRMPVTKVDGGYMPDFTSRYFIEDFSCGLKKYAELAQQYNIDVPNITLALKWFSQFM